jgi:predicted amidohydrolase
VTTGTAAIVRTVAQPPDEFLAACVQFDVRPGDVAANCAAMRAGVEEAVAAGARLCVLPELWSTSFLSTVRRHVAPRRGGRTRTAELSGAHGLVVVGSTIEVVRRPSCSTRPTSTSAATPRGLPQDPPVLAQPRAPDARRRRPTVRGRHVELGRLGVLICYDLRFPELARYYFHRGADLLACPASGRRPARSTGARCCGRARSRTRCS